MRILYAVSTMILAGGTALAQSPNPPTTGPAPGRHITATGKTMPPANPRGAPMKSSTETEMLKAQKATEERNKAWDARTRRTMGTICNGC